MSRVVANRSRFSDARSVRQDDVALKLGEVMCDCDAHARQFAEAGVDSVDRFATGENPLDCRRARGHGSLTRGIDGDRCAAARSPASRPARLAPGRRTTVTVPSRRARAAD